MMLLICLALYPALSGCAADDTTGSTAGHNARASADKEPWWTRGGVSRDKLSAMCWMKYEKGRGDLPIDKRADLVHACIDEAMAKHGMR